MIASDQLNFISPCYQLIASDQMKFFPIFIWEQTIIACRMPSDYFQKFKMNTIKMFVCGHGNVPLNIE